MTWHAIGHAVRLLVEISLLTMCSQRCAALNVVLMKTFLALTPVQIVVIIIITVIVVVINGGNREND